MRRRRQSKEVRIVVTFTVPPSLDLKALTPGVLETYVRDAVQGWMGGYDTDNELRELASKHIKVQTINRFMRYNIGEFQTC
jgi:hypothetical protein